MTYYYHDKLDNKGRVIPTAGMAIQADGWKKYFWGNLTDDDGWRDRSWPGCQFRYEPEVSYGGQVQLGVNIKVTGKPIWVNESLAKSRVKIEWPQDDNEPSQFGGGWIIWSTNSFGHCRIGKQTNQCYC